MKKILTALALTLAFNVQAEVTKQDYCKEMSELGYIIMKMHQHGIAMSKAMETVGKIEASRVMIEMAYGEPRYSTPEYQEKAQAKFRDHVYLICIRED